MDQDKRILFASGTGYRLAAPALRARQRSLDPSPDAVAEPQEPEWDAPPISPPAGRDAGSWPESFRGLAQLPWNDCLAVLRKGTIIGTMGAAGFATVLYTSQPRPKSKPVRYATVEEIEVSRFVAPVQPVAPAAAEMPRPVQVQDAQGVTPEDKADAAPAPIDRLASQAALPEAAPATMETRIAKAETLPVTPILAPPQPAPTQPGPEAAQPAPAARASVSPVAVVAQVAPATPVTLAAADAPLPIRPPSVAPMRAPVRVHRAAMVVPPAPTVTAWPPRASVRVVQASFSARVLPASPPRVMPRAVREPEAVAMALPFWLTHAPKPQARAVVMSEAPHFLAAPAEAAKTASAPAEPEKPTPSVAAPAHFAAASRPVLRQPAMRYAGGSPYSQPYYAPHYPAYYGGPAYAPPPPPYGYGYGNGYFYPYGYGQ